MIFFTPKLTEDKWRMRDMSFFCQWRKVFMRRTSSLRECKWNVRKHPYRLGYSQYKIIPSKLLWLEYFSQIKWCTYMSDDGVVRSQVQVDFCKPVFKTQKQDDVLQILVIEMVFINQLQFNWILLLWKLNSKSEMSFRSYLIWRMTRRANFYVNLNG